jgi:4-diphosphocytidyl-2-C-methyl-D-erythritol kinase
LRQHFVGAFFLPAHTGIALQIQSPCKVNLLLNILGKRPDGFHELETVMYPLRLFDILDVERAASGIELTCSEPMLPTDRKNLVYRAAEAFLAAAGIKDGVRIHLEKRIPLAAGLGGGSGNAASTLLALNKLFVNPLSSAKLHEIAASLGSDIPFFLQDKPALATGRGEIITPLQSASALSGTAFVLIHPGFGIASSWAYQQLANFPDAVNGRAARAGRAQELVAALSGVDAREVAKYFYNSLEAPAVYKFPVLRLYQEFFKQHGAIGTLMSGSGSTTFAVIEADRAGDMVEEFRRTFGKTVWMRVVGA